MVAKEDIEGMDDIKSEREIILDEIKSLEDDKKKLIDKVKKFNEKKRLKSLELKAIEPYLAENKDVTAVPLLRRLRRLEFRLSQTMNPKSEKDVVKEIQKVEKELKGRLKIERMRKRKKLLEGDLNKIDKEIETINQKLKDIREELKDKRTYFKSIKTEIIF